MLRPIRQLLRHIRYHSAARPQTVWTRTADIALVASFLLALPVTWLCDAMMVRERVTINLIGTMLQEPGQPLRAAIMSLNSGRGGPLTGRPFGNFELTARHEHRGWPLTTSIVRQPAQLDLDILSEAQAQKNVALPADSPVRAAIEVALGLEEQEEALAALRQERPLVRQQWISWVIAAGLWWLMMLFASSMALSVTKFIWLHRQARRATRRARRRAAGKCIACGYDMTGLDFNERCPECGEMVW